jgi:hypothetical protein
MPLSVSCPGCAWTGKVPEAHAGRRVKCPKCGEGFAVPRPGEPVEPDVYGLEPEPEPPPPPAAEDDAEAAPSRPGAKRKTSRKAGGGRSWGAIAIGCAVGLLVGLAAMAASNTIMTGGRPQVAPRTSQERARAAGRASGTVFGVIAATVVGGVMADRRSRRGR